MSRRTLAIVVVFLSLLAGTPSSLKAQGWTLDAYAGRAVFDPVSAKVGSNNLSLGLRYAGLEGDWLYLFGAAPLGGANPFWAALGLGRRLTFATRKLARVDLSPAAHLSAGLDLGAHGHGYRDPTSSDLGGGATLEGLPFIALQKGTARLELRSGFLHYASGFSGESESRTLHDSGARLVLSGASPLELTGSARYVRAEEGGYPFAGASASLDHGRGEFWASVGRWFDDALPDLSWSTGASLELGSRLDLWATLRQDAADPIYWNGTRQSWSIGVSRRLGGGVWSPAPVPATGDATRRAADPAAVEVVGRRVIIRLPLSAVHAAPSLAGDFTGWKPLAMRRAGRSWQVELELVPGVYHYAFQTAGGVWFVPESQPGRRDDGFGGHVAVLVVP